MAKDRFGYGTEDSLRGMENLQELVGVIYQEDDIKAPIPKLSKKDGKLHVELGPPPADSEEAYIEWLRGAELMDRLGWDDTAAIFEEAGLSQKQTEIVYTINGKPIDKHKGLFGTNFLKRPGTDFTGGLPKGEK